VLRKSGAREGRGNGMKMERRDKEMLLPRRATSPSVVAFSSRGDGSGAAAALQAMGGENVILYIWVRLPRE
jgi:hypothetical protein